MAKLDSKVNRIAALYSESVEEESGKDNWPEITDQALADLRSGHAESTYKELGIGLHILMETSQMLNHYGTKLPDKLLRIPVYIHKTFRQ